MINEKKKIQEWYIASKTSRPDCLNTSIENCSSAVSQRVLRNSTYIEVEKD